MALAIAKALDEPPEYAVAEIAIERAKHLELQREWNCLARIARQIA